MVKIMKEWRSERVNWEYHLEQARIDKNLTPTRKEKTLAGIRKMREIFGEDWLKEAARTKHPIFYNLCNEAPWARFWLADFGAKLAELKSVQNFDKLKSRLMERKEFHGAEAEMRVAVRLKKSGLLKFLKARHDRKTPDLEVESDGHKVNVEVKNMGTPESIKLASRTLRALAASSSCAESKYNVKVAFKARKILSTPHIQELRDKIFSNAKKATKEKRCMNIIEPRVVGREVFDCLIAPREKLNYLKKWRERKSIARSWEGPLPEMNEVNRVAKSLINAHRQLPKNEPGLIVICQNNLTYGWNIDFPSYLNLNSYLKIVDELEEKVYEHSNLIAAVLVISYYFDGRQPNKTIERGNYFLKLKNFHGLMQEDIIIIKNRYCKLSFPKKVLDAFNEDA